MRIAYIDMIGGVSGDMLLGALIDAGLPLEDLKTELAKLGVGGFDLSASVETRGGIAATLAHVTLAGDGQRVRDWTEFEETIRSSLLSEDTGSTSLRVLDLLARAEAAAHGVSKENTHLHELGTVDTLVDVVGVIAGIERLGIEKVYASPFPLSSGISKSSHGVMAATANATREVYQATGAPVRAGGPYGPHGEAVTPTGAALVATIATFTPVSFTPTATGYGAGSRDPEDYPNVVGLWTGESVSLQKTEFPLDTELVLLETNIDDMTGEMLGYVQERLMEDGALDVWISTVQMKKGRPAVVLSVLCRPDRETRLVDLVLRETTTLGVRRRAVERYIADRELAQVETEYGPVPVKIKRIKGKVAGVHPEYEACREIAMRTGVPLRELVESATTVARNKFRV